MNGLHPLHELLYDIAGRVRETVSASLHNTPASLRSQPVGHAGSDVIYTLDHEVEKQLVLLLEERAGDLGGIMMIAEGIGENECSVYPAGMPENECAWRLLVDPVDGTRGIMMDKRSAWFLAGAAPNPGRDARLREIEYAIMAELPNSRAGFADEIWAVKGEGINARRLPMFDGMSERIPEYRPYAGSSIRGGFAQVARFFPGGRGETAALEDALWARLFPDAEPGEVLGFEDQYISTGGQWVELLAGRDRFCADLRPLLFNSKHFTGKRRGFCCHPYDMAGLLVLEEGGVMITDQDGQPLDAPFDTRSECAWIAYANPAIQKEVEPVLMDLLEERGWRN